MKRLLFIIGVLWCGFVYADGFLLNSFSTFGGGGSPTTEFYDTFTEGSQTELASHDPDTGDASSWTRSDATAFYVEHSTGQTGAVTLEDASSTNKHALNTSTVSGNVTVTAIVGFYASTSSSNDKVGIWARASQSSWSMTGYSFVIAGDGSVNVNEVTSGSGNTLYSGSISGFDWSHDYRLICTLNGTTIGLVIQDTDDGDTQVYSDSDTDSNHSSGSVGMIMRGSDTDETAFCDSLKVEDIP